MKPHIGMKVWEFDESHRVYMKDSTGRSFGGPIWREHWRPVYVVGETKKSWLIGSESMIGKEATQATKVPKRTWPGDLKLSEEDIDKAAFVEARWTLAERIRACRDYDTLKAIDAALNALDR